ncbi:MAG: EF-P lysine aminoacylase EpmA [bacterium]|nr:EF-P lysine aminoacylase EpmA [bacterium]
MKTWKKLKRNPEQWSQYLVREQVLDGIREFFKQQEFMEVETPLLLERPSTETYLEFFDTQLQTADGQNKTGFLITSPEYAMKKLLVAGSGNIFQITKSFRNTEGLSPKHNPEFTILEWYRTPADYQDIMSDCEELLLHLIKKVAKWQSEQTFLPANLHFENNKTILTYQGEKYDFTPPWPRISVSEAFNRFAGITKEELCDERLLLTAAENKGYQITKTTTWEEVYNQIFLNEIDRKIAEFSTPVILYDYPASQAALSQKKKKDPRFAERFEFFVAGIELGNAFSELADAQEQEQRLRSDLQLRKKIGKKSYELDDDFLDALHEGLPPTGGIAVGVDRLVMLLADTSSIHETMFFPVADTFDLEKEG